MKTELVTINYNQLPAFNGAKEKQEALLKENPFIEVVDNKTYQEAKKRRTALKSGRTELQSGEKTIASKLREFRDTVKTKTLELIGITKEAEEKQQAEIDRYEAQKEEERKEKERQEQERLLKLRNKLNELITIYSTKISTSDLSKIDEVYKEIEELEGDFEDYQNEFLIKRSNLISECLKKKNQLEEDERLRIEKENQEKEAERLRLEKEEFEKEKKEAEEKRKKEQEAERKKLEAERQELAQKNNANNVINSVSTHSSILESFVKISQFEGVEREVESLINKSFGKHDSRVEKAYKAFKEKFDKLQSDLIERLEAEAAQKAKEEKQRQELGKKRQEQLKSINVHRSIDDCLSINETAYFNYFQEKQKDFNEAEKVRIENEKKEAERKRVEAEKQENERKKQAELMKSDAEKAKDLIEGIEKLIDDLQFESSVYQNWVKKICISINDIEN